MTGDFAATPRDPLRTDTARHYIGGNWVESATTGVSYSPADGTELGTYYEVEKDQVAEAIQVAKRTFATHEWRTNRQLRAQVLNEMADRIEAAADELALLLARENGKTLAQ
ncbi:MAG: aldehyde dehydrogenase family protein, partial [Saccharomonospora viridis]